MNEYEGLVLGLVNGMSGDSAGPDEIRVPEFNRTFCLYLERLIRTGGRVKSNFNGDEKGDLALGTLDVHYLWSTHEWAVRFDQYTAALAEDVVGCTPEEAIRAFNYLAVNLVAAATLKAGFNQRAAFGRMVYQFWKGAYEYALQFDPSLVSVINTKFQAAGYAEVLEHYPGVPLDFGYAILYFLIGKELI